VFIDVRACVRASNLANPPQVSPVKRAPTAPGAASGDSPRKQPPESVIPVTKDVGAVSTAAKPLDSKERGWDFLREETTVATAPQPQTQSTSSPKPRDSIEKGWDFLKHASESSHTTDSPSKHQRTTPHLSDSSQRDWNILSGASSTGQPAYSVSKSPRRSDHYPLGSSEKGWNFLQDSALVNSPTVQPPQSEAAPDEQPRLKLTSETEPRSKPVSTLSSPHPSDPSQREWNILKTEVIPSVVDSTTVSSALVSAPITDSVPHPADSSQKDWNFLTHDVAPRKDSGDLSPRARLLNVNGSHPSDASQKDWNFLKNESVAPTNATTPLSRINPSSHVIWDFLKEESSNTANSKSDQPSPSSRPQVITSLRS
jgi:hypothetical protein